MWELWGCGDTTRNQLASLTADISIRILSSCDPEPDWRGDQDTNRMTSDVHTRLSPPSDISLPKLSQSVAQRKLISIQTTILWLNLYRFLQLPEYTTKQENFEDILLVRGVGEILTGRIPFVSSWKSCQ